MLHNRTPERFTRRCYMYATMAVGDKYGCETIREVGAATELSLIPQPISDKAVLEEYGVKYEQSLQAAVFDERVDIRHFYHMKIGSKTYSIVGIKRYPSHRLLIMERMQNEE